MMNGQSNNRNFTHKGFTLIEVLVVLVLICLILGISTVFFANLLSKAKQKAAAREIVSTIKYAKKLAASKNERQTLTFDLDAGNYRIKGRSEIKLPEEVQLMIYPSGVNVNPVSKGQYNIVFDSEGGSDWERIRLARGDKIIWIENDPIMMAVIAHEDKGSTHE